MSYLKQILAVLIGLGLIVLVFVLVIKGFNSGKTASPISSVDLVNYANTDASAVFTIDGPVIAQQDHNTVRITVAQTQTEIEIIQGYDGKVVNSQTFPNSQTGYAIFLQSLARLNFTKGSTSPYDERGYCSSGDRYIYQLSQGSKDILRYWSTSCGQGTFGGSRADVRSLFENQIPEEAFNTLTNGLNI